MSAKTPYAEKFRDPRWQRKRLEIMQRDEFKCLDCESAEKTLNVHHRYYAKDRDPWEYPDWCLQTLCEECHENLHFNQDGSPIQEWEHVCQHLMPIGNGCVNEWDLHTTLGIALKQGFSKDECIFAMLQVLTNLIESKAPDLEWNLAPWNKKPS